MRSLETLTGRNDTNTHTSADPVSGLNQNNGVFLAAAVCMMREESCSGHNILQTLTGFRPDWSFCFPPCPLSCCWKAKLPTRQITEVKCCTWLSVGHGNMVKTCPESVKVFLGLTLKGKMHGCSVRLCLSYSNKHVGIQTNRLEIYMTEGHSKHFQ